MSIHVNLFIYPNKIIGNGSYMLVSVYIYCIYLYIYTFCSTYIFEMLDLPTTKNPSPPFLASASVPSLLASPIFASVSSLFSFLTFFWSQFYHHSPVLSAQYFANHKQTPQQTIYRQSPYSFALSSRLYYYDGSARTKEKYRHENSWQT